MEELVPPARQLISCRNPFNLKLHSRMRLGVLDPDEFTVFRQGKGHDRGESLPEQKCHRNFRGCDGPKDDARSNLPRASSCLRHAVPWHKRQPTARRGGTAPPSQATQANIAIAAVSPDRRRAGEENVRIQSHFLSPYDTGSAATMEVDAGCDTLSIVSRYTEYRSDFYVLSRSFAVVNVRWICRDLALQASR